MEAISRLNVNLGLLRMHQAKAKAAQAEEQSRLEVLPPFTDDSGTDRASQKLYRRPDMRTLIM